MKRAVASEPLTLAQAVIDAIGACAGDSMSALVSWATQDPHRLIATVIGDVSAAFRLDGQDQPYERDIIAELIRQIGAAEMK